MLVLFRRNEISRVVDLRDPFEVLDQTARDGGLSWGEGKSEFWLRA